MKKIKPTNNLKSVSLRPVILATSLAGLVVVTYFFFGPNGEGNQKKTRAWAVRMRGGVKPVYHGIIDSVTTEYEKGLKAGRKEIKSLAEDLKKHWETIRNSVMVKT